MPNFTLVGLACDWKVSYSPVGVAVCTLVVQFNLVPLGNSS